MDAIDRQILDQLVADGRSTYDAIAVDVSLSAPAVKRRVDRLRSSGAIRGFTAVLDHAQLGEHTEALIELFFAPGSSLDYVAQTLSQHSEILEAWSVTGEADAIARVRTKDNGDLERLIRELQRDGTVERTRSQVVLSRLIPRDPSASGSEDYYYLEEHGRNRYRRGEHRTWPPPDRTPPPDDAGDDGIPF